MENFLNNRIGKRSRGSFLQFPSRKLSCYCIYFDGGNFIDRQRQIIDNALFGFFAKSVANTSLKPTSILSAIIKS